MKKVAIIGMGALGLLYANIISASEKDTDVYFVMDKARAERNKEREYTINGKAVQFKMLSAEEATAADLVIVAVKFKGLESALDVMQTSVGPDTTIISVMNGISSEKIIGERYGMEKIVYCIAQGMDAQRFGSSLSFTQIGALRLGVLKGDDTARLDWLCTFFDDISMPYVKEEDILYRLWFKFMLNVGLNQVCMVYGATFSGVTKPGLPNALLISAMREVMAIAKAEGVELTEEDINTCMAINSTLSPDGTPSMGQDRINKNPSEVDMFAGTVIELGKKHGILVPVNQYIYEKVKEIEAQY